ncbi:MAG TPA: DNRLRE domain-containing protein [Kofleriaceae bacterium]
MRWWLLVTLCACRIGFDEHPHAGADAPIDSMTGDATITTITFGERPTSQRKGVTIDATVSQPMPSFNFGGAEDLSLAEFASAAEHGLLRFDVSSIAAGTAVIGARLALTRLDYGDETVGPMQLRLLDESWVPGTATGMPGPGVTWQTRDGTRAWITAGGTTSRTLTTMTPTAAELVMTFDPAAVQAWVDDPTTNVGLLVTVGASTAHFHLHTSNSVLAAARPELTLDIAQ